MKHEIEGDVSGERAFESFADRLGEWWPLVYTFSGPRFESAQIESKPGGHWYERTQSGEVLSWAAVRAYERGKHLILALAIGSDRKPAPPSQASEVEVTFDSLAPKRTRVRVEPRDFERHGENAAMMRDGMDSQSGGWPIILAEFHRRQNRIGSQS